VFGFAEGGDGDDVADGDAAGVGDSTGGVPGSSVRVAVGGAIGSAAWARAFEIEATAAPKRRATASAIGIGRNGRGGRITLSMVS
jgi:hypothetical protein